jgi:RNA polymerase sigma factor (sigma-70 family)
MIQKNSKRTEIEFQFQEEGFQVAISAEMRLIDGQLDHHKRKLLEKKLNELPPLQREALILYFYEGLKYQQIAEMLGIKTKSSRELVYRATNSLGTLLAPYRDSMLSFAGTIAVMKISL